MVARSLRVAACVCGAALGLACAAVSPNPLAYEPEPFRQALRERVPGLPARLAEPPFVVDPEIVERARTFIRRSNPGPERVQQLVDFLSHPAPEGLGLEYDWQTTATAERTIELGRGNCVALASVLVGIGRGLGWPIYYAEARTTRPQAIEFEDVTALSDHMVVIVTPRSFQMIVDFTGLIDEVEELRPIDDVKAYAHIVNNIAAQRLMIPDAQATEEQWAAGVDGFRLAVEIEPTLGRAWNNLGIALSRSGRIEEARDAYERAVELDTAFGSAGRNLTLMETRVFGEAQVVTRPRPVSGGQSEAR